MRPRLSHGELRALKEQERRDARAAQRDEAVRHQRWAAQRRAMTIENKFGSRVEKFPQVDELRDRIGSLRSALAEAFDQAEEDKGRQSRMAASRSADGSRFPSLGGQS